MGLGFFLGVLGLGDKVRLGVVLLPDVLDDLVLFLALCFVYAKSD